jgi:serine O-acetyltransferase
MEHSTKKDECRFDLAACRSHRDQIPDVVDDIVESCTDEGSFCHLGPETIPSRQAVTDIVQRAFRILFPGYFSTSHLDDTTIRYYIGEEVTALYELLAEQITLSVQHDCLRYNQPCSHCLERGHRTAIALMREFPRLRRMLSTDVHATYDGDPAAETHDEIIFCYPGVFAIAVYRMAHHLFEHKVPLLPRIMTEYAHTLTGIDIHPGAHIGTSFFIDHGTGVVIGETTEIGNRVRIYQGVTLGALSLKKDEVDELRKQKRHPTIEDDVIIYASASILGGKTVIGARSVIGGNVWLTDSVPPDTEVFLRKPDLVFRKIPH